jgi:hypothetical protein
MRKKGERERERERERLGSMVGHDRRGREGGREGYARRRRVTCLSLIMF